MKTKTIWASALTLAASIWATQATAIVLEDEQHPGILLADGDSHTLTHDLSSDIPGDYLATSGSLTLGFTDDGQSLNGDPGDAVEWVTWELADIVGSTEVGDFLFLSTVVLVDLTVTAVADLNADGLLDVTVTVDDTTGFVNDVIWYSSILTVYAQSVPEPSTLVLLGGALLGMGYMRRKAGQNA